MTPVQGDLKQLFRQSSHYLAGLVASLALGFVSFPIYTRLFSVSDYGLIDFAQKIILLTVAFSKCGLQNSALRFYHRAAFDSDRGAEQRYYSTMLFLVAGISAAIALLFACLVKWSPSSIVDVGLRAVLVLAAGLILLRGVQSIVWAFFRLEERTKAYNVVNVIIRVATLGAVCALVPWFGASVRTYFLGTLLIEAAVTVALVYPLVKRGLAIPRQMDSVMARAAFAFGLPLVIQEIAGLVLDSGDRVVVRHFLGDHALGLYSVAYGLSGYVNTLVMAPLGLAILPLYMKIWNRDGSEKTIEFLSQGLDVFLVAAGLMMALAATGAHDAVILLASSRYAGADRLVPILVAGLLIYTAQVFLNAGLLIHKKTGIMATILGASAVLNLALNWFLVPYMGLQAAALATLIAYLVCTAWLAFASFRSLPLHVSVVSMAKYGLAAALAWSLAAAVELGSPIANLPAKGAIVTSVYFLALYAADARFRHAATALVRMLLRRDAEGVALAVSLSK